MPRRSPFFAWLVFVVALLAPRIASASWLPNAENRVRGLDLAAPTLGLLSVELALEKHHGIGCAYDENASGSPHAARGASSIDDLSRAAGAADRGGLTAAGRALQKHGVGQEVRSPLREGTPRRSTKLGRGSWMIVDDILTSPGSTTTTRHHARFGDVTEIRAPDGRGVRYDANGVFIGFLEP